MTKRNRTRPVIKAQDWDGSHPIGDFINKFRVYPKLTAALDSRDWNFTPERINEIVLWKVARYVDLPVDLLLRLDALKNIEPNEHRKGAEALSQLLAIKGARLPMASTFLRFANPKVFQIFDRHIYRALNGELPKQLSKSPSQCVPIYMKFIDELHVACESMSIPFSDADRILFIFDKKVNGSMKESSLDADG